MKTPDRRIIKMINKHHVLTLATCNGAEPWCASCFYVWSDKLQGFIFTSDESTRHGVEAKQNPVVAANIYLETKIVGKIRGIQVSGTMYQPENDILKMARKRYLKRFPYARFMDMSLWVLNPTIMKMTDNRLGFGKKMIWKNSEDSIIR